MNAREQIVRVLEEVFEQGAYSNIALNQALEHSQLSDKDRSFVTEVVYGQLELVLLYSFYTFQGFLMSLANTIPNKRSPSNLYRLK